MNRTSTAPSGSTGYLLMAMSAVICAVIFVALQQLKPKGRKIVIVTVTFLAGLFYVAEFYLPVTLINGEEKNALTPYLPVAGGLSPSLSAFALCLGVYTLYALHRRNLLRARPALSVGAA